MNPPLRAIFFDAGGTLIHMDPACILAALAQHDQARDAAEFARADVAARRAVVAWLQAGNRALGERARWGVYARALLDSLACPPEAEPTVWAAVGARHVAATLWTYTLPGTLEVLRQLRAAGFTLGIVSNADGRVATFLEHAGLRPEFDFIVDSAAVGVEKPDPHIFELACERAGVAPEEATHIGDVYEVDVLGARAAGVRPILYDPDDLLPDADCARVRSLAELPALLVAAAAA